MTVTVNAGAIEAGPVRRRLTGLLSGLLTANRAAVAAMTALTALAYSAFELLRYDHFKTSSYDLLIFYQAVRSYAHFQPGISIVKGVQDGFGPHFSVLGDHFSPIIATLAPLLWIADRPQTLLVAQGALFALAIPPLWLFTRRVLGGGPNATAAAYLVCFAYALSWPVSGAVDFDFHEVAFVPVLTAVALERLHAGRLRWALLALGGLLLVKEDMGLLVAGIGIFLAVGRPAVISRQRLVALCLIAAGLADTWFTTRVVIPAMGGRTNFYWVYDALGKNVPQVALHLITHPLSSLQLLVTPVIKIRTMIWLLAPFCFLSLLSPITLAIVPLLLERMLGSDPHWWAAYWQYNAFLVMVLAFGGADGAARLGRWIAWARRRFQARGTGAARDGAARDGRPTGQIVSGFALGCASVMAVLAVALLPRFDFSRALHASFYSSSPQIEAAAGAVAAVPPGVCVEAEDNLGPQLASRDTVLLWDIGAPRWAPWVVAYVGKPYWPFATVTAEVNRVDLLQRNGYQVVYNRDEYIVLHRGGALPPSCR